MLTGKAGEAESLVARAGDLVEEQANLGERVLNGSQERALEIRAQCLPVLLAF